MITELIISMKSWKEVNIIQTSDFPQRTIVSSCVLGLMGIQNTLAIKKTNSRHANDKNDTDIYYHVDAKPSGTAAESFKLRLQPLKNPYTSDLAYQRVLSWYLPPHILEELNPKLIKYGNEAISDQINDWISDAERNPPYLKKRDVWTNEFPHDKLITSHGWKELGKWGISNGVVALAYEGKFREYGRIVQHAFNYLYSASSAVYSCPAQITREPTVRDFPDHPFHEGGESDFFAVDDGEGWGSDVRNSESVAVYSPPQERGGGVGFQNGDFLVSGYKFFCSATDCQIALMLAQEADTGKLGLFVAPTKIEGRDGKLVTNGIRFHRLKTKMGAKELPTAELELKDVRARRVKRLTIVGRTTWAWNRYYSYAIEHDSHAQLHHGTIVLAKRNGE
ncbi:uncharacterized protein MYCFIDRAFT_173808 [Pseudocercospora fijiensis CIRAD86]|uniref:Acyl-CoA oxidase/dehydrogenase middle domain-containing protein n=1 Tax=Pseudocercospora fijiensis (strain CIRAD86) TaxID=383855 RepID=M3B6E9_PSEFD|nr:uncharacterized protein MYCFIDRAFT_173808 [Pseudocercospora fijiensis CIRAD86]EME84913.1 hypothetical protein MYCFIDRAFT_173808 [Pseudocercospora fijiensis CIRAD86]